jgi:hypothetical protein
MPSQLHRQGHSSARVKRRVTSAGTDGRLHDPNAWFQMIGTRLFDAWVGTIAHRLLNLIPPQFQLSMRPQGVGCGHRLFRQEAAGSRTGGR